MAFPALHVIGLFAVIDALVRKPGLLNLKVSWPLEVVISSADVVAKVNPPTKPRVGVQRAIYVAESDADARDAAEHARWNMRVTMSLRNHYEQVENGKAMPIIAKSEPTIEDLLEHYLIIGSPETCIRQIKTLQSIMGITHFNCSFWFGDLSQTRVLKSMELFAKEVMPAIA